MWYRLLYFGEFCVYSLLFIYIHFIFVAKYLVFILIIVLHLCCNWLQLLIGHLFDFTMWHSNRF